MSKKKQFIKFTKKTKPKKTCQKTWLAKQNQKNIFNFKNKNKKTRLKKISQKKPSQTKTN
jgi:hypothetical protein